MNISANMEISAKSFFLLSSEAYRNSLMKKTETKKSRATVPLKVPKHEIFDGGFFASKEPIWSPNS
jgi:hypothetical protein